MNDNHENKKITSSPSNNSINSSFKNNLKFNSPEDINNETKSPLMLDNPVPKNEGELIYIDVNENNNLNNEYQENTLLNQLNSQLINKGNSIVKLVKNELYENYGSMNTEEIPLIDLNFKERSPKTINIGDSKEETEYNLRTLRNKKGMVVPPYTDSKISYCYSY